MLKADFQCYVMRRGGEGLTGGQKGLLRCIVLLREVGQHRHREIRAEFTQHIGRRLVGEVTPPVFVGNPLFQKFRIGPVFKHHRAVVAFEDEGITAGEAGHHCRRHHPGIGADTHGHLTV